MGALQLLLPIVFIFNVAAILKSRGGFGWVATQWDISVPPVDSSNATPESLSSMLLLSPVFFRSPCLLVLVFLSHTRCSIFE
jgi:hypothetical protein